MVCLRGTVGNWKQGAAFYFKHRRERDSGRLLFTLCCGRLAPEGLTDCDVIEHTRRVLPRRRCSQKQRKGGAPEYDASTNWKQGAIEIDVWSVSCMGVKLLPAGQFWPAVQLYFACEVTARVASNVQKALRVLWHVNQDRRFTEEYSSDVTGL